MANMIQDDSKVAVFLTVIGASNYAYVVAEPPGTKVNNKCQLMVCT